MRYIAVLLALLGILVWMTACTSPTSSDETNETVESSEESSTEETTTLQEVESTTQIEEETDPHQHALIEVEAKAPTCLEIGWAAYVKCTECDYTTYQRIFATGHDYGVWMVVTEPSCVAGLQKCEERGIIMLL